MKRLLFLLTALVALSGLPAAAENPTPDPLAQSVDSAEAIRSEPAEVGVGHVDLGPKLIEGSWRFLARDGNPHPAVWRDPSTLVIRVNDHSLVDIPHDEQFNFLNAAGSQAYVVPQTQLSSVVWLGFSTQDPQAVAAMGRGGYLELLHASGPGSFQLFTHNSFDKPIELWDSNDTSQKRFFLDANTHTHANWVFDKPGMYYLDIAFSPESGAAPVKTRLNIAVGDSTEAVMQAPTSPAASSPASPQPSQTQPSIAAPTIWIAAGLIAVGALAVSAVRYFRRRKED